MRNSIILLIIVYFATLISSKEPAANSQKKLNSIKIVSIEQQYDSQAKWTKSKRYGFKPKTSRFSLLGSNFPLIRTSTNRINLTQYVCAGRNDSICNWNSFTAIINKYNKPLAPMINDLQHIHLFIVCESLQGQHEMCPNPCKNEKLNCESKNGPKSICLKTYWGLYRNDFMCTCGKNEIWNEELQKCVKYNKCLWEEDYDGVCNKSGKNLGKRSDEPEFWRPWGHWTDCHASCGQKGYKARKRICNINQNSCLKTDTKDEYGSMRYDRCIGSCTSRVKFTWSQWTECVSECNQRAYQKRHIECVDRKSSTKIKCAEKIFGDVEKRKCVPKKCLKGMVKLIKALEANNQSILYTWSSWSNCFSPDSGSCQYGQQYRNLICKSSLSKCDLKEKKMQIRRCIVKCNEFSDLYPWSTWTSWSLCQKKEKIYEKCYRRRFCTFEGGCSKRVNKQIEVETANCVNGVCKGTLPIVNLFYIADRQGRNSAQHFFRFQSLYGINDQGEFRQLYKFFNSFK